MTYRIDHIPLARKLQRPGTAMTPATLTIHSTGNLTSTARGEQNNLAKNSTRQASFHIVVDEQEAVECIPLNEIAWHAGNATGNRTSIGLEICESGDREATLAHAAEVTAHLLVRYGWGVDKLRQHYDWSRKNCPRILRDTGSWGWFVAQVNERLEELTMVRYKTLADVPAGEFRETIQALIRNGVIKGDGTGVINLSEDMVRLLVILYRAGVFGR